MKNVATTQQVRFPFRLLAGLLSLFELPAGAFLVFAQLHVLVNDGADASIGWSVLILGLGICALASGLVFAFAAISGREPFASFGKCK